MPRRLPIPAFAWWFAPYLVASVVHVVALAAGSPAASPTKLTLMPLLAVPILIAAITGTGTGTGTQNRQHVRTPLVLLLAAVALSWLGDSAGTFFPTAPTLPLMLGFFGLAHLAYITLFWRTLRIRRWHLLALLFVGWWIGMLVVLGPHTGALFPAVALYGIVLGGTAALATRCRPMILVGGVFFLASDTILAFRLFLPDAMPAWTSPAVMATYTVGQGLIVAGALLALHSRRLA